MQTEPVRNAAAIGLAIQGAVMALVTMAASLGWINVNPDQMSAVEKAVGALIGLGTLAAPLVLALWARGKVIPVASLPPQVAAQMRGLAPLSDDPEAEPLPRWEAGRDLR